MRYAENMERGITLAAVAGLVVLALWWGVAFRPYIARVMGFYFLSSLSIIPQKGLVDSLLGSGYETHRGVYLGIDKRSRQIKLGMDKGVKVFVASNPLEMGCQNEKDPKVWVDLSYNPKVKALLAGKEKFAVVDGLIDLRPNRMSWLAQVYLVSRVGENKVDYAHLVPCL